MSDERTGDSLRPGLAIVERRIDYRVASQRAIRLASRPDRSSRRATPAAPTAQERLPADWDISESFRRARTALGQVARRPRGAAPPRGSLVKTAKRRRS